MKLWFIGMFGSYVWIWRAAKLAKSDVKSSLSKARWAGTFVSGSARHAFDELTLRTSIARCAFDELGFAIRDFLYCVDSEFLTNPDRIDHCWQEVTNIFS